MMTLTATEPRYCTLLHRVCCVCGRMLGVTDGRGIRGVSHGYCPACFQKAVAEAVAFGDEEHGHGAVDHAQLETARSG